MLNIKEALIAVPIKLTKNIVSNHIEQFSKNGINEIEFELNKPLLLFSLNSSKRELFLAIKKEGIKTTKTAGSKINKNGIVFSKLMFRKLKATIIIHSDQPIIEIKKSVFFIF